MTLKYKSPCPDCFAQSGHSIVMEEKEEGVFQCPKNRQHKYTRDEETGFWNLAR